MNRANFIKYCSLASFAPLMLKLEQLDKLLPKLSTTNPMPMLFIGHGSPMNAIEENEFVKGWRKKAASIEIPKAILCISAHWETKGTFVTAMDNPKTIHDFGGFPQELFDVQYPAPGSPELAISAKEMVESTEIGLDHEWGFDHGSWSVVKQMYPDANIPMIQMSIDHYKNGDYYYNLGKELSALRRKGVLIIGSGNIVHNLRMVNWQMQNRGFDWAIEANEGFKKRINSEKFNELTQLRNLGNAYQLAIPTFEHYNPLLYLLGMKEKNEDISLFNDELVMGSISMISLQIG